MPDKGAGGAAPRVAKFYDDLAAHYHLLFEDWDETIARQGRCLDRLIGEMSGPGPKTVLDATCGIGTQSLGLAQRGHRVSGSDLSCNAVERARLEARRRALPVEFRVCDVRRLGAAHSGGFDVVCALNNALPHLLGDEDLVEALRQMAAMTIPGGLLLASTRDYDRLKAERPRSTGLKIIDDGLERRVVFQLWDWEADGSLCHLQIFIIRQCRAQTETLVFPSVYRALTRAMLTAALQAAGLTGVRWLMPEESGFYQPLVVARAAGPRAGGHAGTRGKPRSTTGPQSPSRSVHPRQGASSL